MSTSIRPSIASSEMCRFAKTCKYGDNCFKCHTEEEKYVQMKREIFKIERERQKNVVALQKQKEKEHIILKEQEETEKTKKILAEIDTEIQNEASYITPKDKVEIIAYHGVEKDRYGQKTSRKQILDEKAILLANLLSRTCEEEKNFTPATQPDMRVDSYMRKKEHLKKRCSRLAYLLDYKLWLLNRHTHFRHSTYELWQDRLRTSEN